MSPAEQKLPRFVTSIVGPGDPVWHGKPDRDRARRLRNAIETDTRGRQTFRTPQGIRRLRTQLDYDRFNQVLGSA